MKIDRFISGEAVKSMVDALLLVGSDDRILDVNSAAVEMYGYTRPELLHLKWRAIRPPDQPVSDGAPASKVSHGTRIEKHRRADGKYLPVEVRSASVQAGRNSGTLYAVQDITYRQDSAEALRALLTATIDVVGRVSELHHSYIEGHQRRVAELASAMAVEMGMSEKDVDDIRVAALIHDVGKTLVPSELLSRPTAITLEEYVIIQRHPQTGYELITAAKMGGPIAELVYQHHERCDGSGYPRGLTVDQLLPGSKVLQVADVVEAMTASRPYREAFGIEAALAEVEQGSGRLYDRRAVESCLRLFRERGFEFA